MKTQKIEKTNIQIMTDTSNIIIVLHNVESPNRCIEFTRIGIGMGFKNLVITKANASAATKGVPSAQKLAVQKKINFLYLQDIPDAIELLQPEHVITIAPPKYGKYTLKKDYFQPFQGKKTLIIIGGNDPGLSRRELDLGDPVELPLTYDIGTIGTLTLTLYLLREFEKTESQMVT